MLLITDGRFSGGTTGLCVGRVPERSMVGRSGCCVMVIGS